MSARAGLVALFVADVISSLGSKISLVAIPWLVLTSTGSPAKMGLVAAAEMLPYMLSAVLATPLADRLGLRRTSVLTDAGSALAMAVVAATPSLGFGALLVLVAVAGGLRGVGDRAKHVLMRPMAEAANVTMIRVTSAYEGLTRGAMLLGAPLGGLLVFWFTAAGAIWVDAATFAACALIVGLLVRPPAPADPEQDPADQKPVASEPYLTALRGGFRHLNQDRLLLGMLGLVFGLNVFSNASIAVFIPLWVSEVLRSPAGLGLVLGAFSAGALLGNVGFTALAPKLPRLLSFAIGAALSGAPRLLALALSDHLVLVLTVTFVSGVAIATVNPVMGAMLYERVPHHLQTRVFGIASAVGFAGFPIGALLGGWAVAGLGLQQGLLAASALCVLVTVLPLFSYRRLLTRDLEPDPHTSSEIAASDAK